MTDTILSPVQLRTWSIELVFGMWTEGPSLYDNPTHGSSVAFHLTSIPNIFSVRKEAIAAPKRRATAHSACSVTTQRRAR
jgi:hypothetical protein